MTPPAPENRTEGFVILEALVTLVLVALTFGLVAGVIGFGHRVSEAGRSRDRLSALAGGGSALETWLASASALRPREGEGRGPVLFEGRSDRLSVLTLHGGDPLPPGLLAVTVGFSGGRDGALLFDAAPMPPGDLRLPDMTARQTLVPHVAAARFRYFGEPIEGAPPRWHDEWTAATRLPRLIELRLNLDLGHRVEPVTLAFRTRAE
jgi:hypothetical protein